MASRVALHVHSSSPQVDGIIRSAPWCCVKSLGNTQPLQTARDAGVPIRILREWGIEDGAPDDAGRRLLSHDLSAVTHVQIACEASVSYDPSWQQIVIDTLRNGGYGGGCIVGGFPTGNPSVVQDGVHPGEHFPELLPLLPLLKQGHALGLDEYAGVAPDDPLWPAWVDWTARRHRKLLGCLANHGVHPDCYILEAGVDQVIPGVPAGGWQARGISNDRMLALIAALDQADQADAQVKGRCYFSLNASADWVAKGFELLPLAPAMAAYVQSQRSKPVPDYEQAVWSPSPNFWAGRDGMQPTAIVLHGTAGAGAVSWFANPTSQVSAHYVVDTDGSVTQCVAEADTAWANGIVGAGGVYPATPNPNYFTLSVEHVRDITNTSPLTAAQLASSLSLTADMLRRHPSVATIIGHDSIQPGRVCPGPGFPLSQFQALLKGAGNVDDLYAMQWKSYKQDTAVNTAAAIYRDWLAKRQAGDHSYGVPTTQEFPHGGGVAQLFTGGLATWDAANGVRWF